MTLPLSWLLGGAAGVAALAAITHGSDDSSSRPSAPTAPSKPVAINAITPSAAATPAWLSAAASRTVESRADQMVAKVLAQKGRFRWDAANGVGERFSDARYFCFGPRGTPYSIDPGTGGHWNVGSTGHEYLRQTSAASRARIDLLRKRVAAWPKDPSKRTGVDVLREVSAETLYKISLDIYRASQSQAGTAYFASLLGADVSKVKLDLGNIAKVFQNTSGTLASDAAQLVMRNAYGMIAPYLLAQLKVATAALGITGEMLANTAAAVPFIGAVVGMLLEMNAALLQERRLLWVQNCQGYYTSQIQPWIEKTVRRGYPLPWHLPDLISFGCPDSPDGVLASAERWVPGHLEIIANTYRENYEFFARLPHPAVLDIAKWWSLALALMNVPDVGNVFDALGWASMGGSLWASDEQVLLVAAPIAVANGLPVYAFAEALHRLSNGWLDRPEAERIPQERRIPVYACPETHWYDPTTWVASACDLVGNETICGNRAANSYHLNFAELTRNAFEIAALVKTAPV